MQPISGVTSGGYWLHWLYLALDFQRDLLNLGLHTVQAVLTLSSGFCWRDNAVDVLLRTISLFVIAPGSGACPGIGLPAA